MAGANRIPPPAARCAARPLSRPFPNDQTPAAGRLAARPDLAVVSCSGRPGTTILLPLWEEVACEAGRRWGLSERSASFEASFRAARGARPHLRQPAAATSSHEGRRTQIQYD